MERLTRQATTVGASRTLDFAYDKPGNLTSKLSNVGPDPGTIQARAEFWYPPDSDRYLGRELWNDAGTQRTAITTCLWRATILLPASATSRAVPPARP